MKRSIVATLLGTLLCASRLAFAGPFADDMAKCLVNSTSPEDRTDPLVMGGLKDRTKYVDEDKLKNLTAAASSRK